MRAYIIADNQLALNAGWNDELLRIELAALQEEEFNLDLIGFDDVELARLLAAQDAAEGLTDEDAVPELPETPTSAAAAPNPFCGRVKMPKLAGVTWMGRPAPVRPLYVTVTVPLPAGVREGKIAATWFDEV